MSTMLQHLQSDVSTHTILCRRAGRKTFAVQMSRSRIHSGLPSLPLSVSSPCAVNAAKKERSENAAQHKKKKKSFSFPVYERHFKVRWKQARFNYIIVYTLGRAAWACTELYTGRSKQLFTLSKCTNHYENFKAYRQSLNWGLPSKQRKELLELHSKLTT